MSEAERSGSLELRRATPEDGERIAEVYLRSIRWALPQLRLAHTEPEIREHFAHKVAREQETWVATGRQGEVIGFITLSPGWVEHLYVDPDQTGRGVGSDLLRLATQRPAQSTTLYTFQSNVRARAFYEARGFRPVDFSDGERNMEHEPDVLYSRPHLP